MYHKNPMYWDREACTNSADPDQALQNTASDLGLYCLPLSQQFLDALQVVKWTCSKFRISMVRSYGIPVLWENMVFL